MTLIQILLALFVPPIAVFTRVGLGLHFWLNLLLTLCFFVPGQIHAIWVLLRR